jgi:hypothetical protein
MQYATGAALVPAMNASVWQQGISTQLVVFKDWAKYSETATSCCFVSVQKPDGKGTTETTAALGNIGQAVAFKVEDVRLLAVALN